MTGIADMGSTLRIFRPAANVLAFYDGRVPGRRGYAAEPNWLDDGAYSLGICSYAIVDGSEAIVYDTHMSVTHAERIRAAVRDAGARHVRVVLSHWHTDHVAGNAVFADCEIIAHAWTLDALLAHQEDLESGRRPPAIKPLVLPTTTYTGTHTLAVGGTRIELRHVDIHSRDGTMLVLPGQRLLLAGDALEDTVTYVSEPEGLANHQRDLDRMAGWQVDRILPCHGDPGIIAGGGYGTGLITATQRYLDRLLRCRTEPVLREQTLRQFVADDLAGGCITYFEPYEAVHKANVARVAAL